MEKYENLKKEFQKNNKRIFGKATKEERKELIKRNKEIWENIEEIHKKELEEFKKHI